MFKKALLLAAMSTAFLFEEGGGCGSNHLLLYGGVGLGALLLGGALARGTTSTGT